MVWQRRRRSTRCRLTIYIWRKKYGSLEPSQVSELKRITQENARLKKLVAERDLEIEVMKEIAAKWTA